MVRIANVALIFAYRLSKLLLVMILYTTTDGGWITAAV
jgi:hypothetical protein